MRSGGGNPYDELDQPGGDDRGETGEIDPDIDDDSLYPARRWLATRFWGAPARGGTPRDAEFFVIKTHVSRGFWWNARQN
jgi:hypothetical protein